MWSDTNLPFRWWTDEIGSANGILICHFMPECYIIIFKSLHNTREAFKRGSFGVQMFSPCKATRGSAKSWTRPARQCIYYWICNQEYIINRSNSNPYPTGTLSSFHLSIENLPHELRVSADSLSASSVTSGSSAEMNEENLQKQTVSDSQKIIIRIKNYCLEFRRTSRVPHF